MRVMTLLVVLLLGACGERTGEPAPGPERHPLGKADLTGSCQATDGDRCGGKSAGTCWCDAACTTWKDCCLDYQATCNFEPPAARRTFADSLSFPGGTAQVAVAFFDADGTLRVSKSGKTSPDDATDVLLLPGVATGLRAAAQKGELPVIVSNQGGVAYGYITFEAAEGALAETARLLADKKARIQYFDFATTYGKDRKPNTGMADRLEQTLADTHGVSIDWAKSYMVGDAGWKSSDTEPDGSPGVDFSNSDRGFAEKLSIPYIHPRTYFGWIAEGVKRFDTAQEVADFRAAHPDFGD